MRDYVIAVALAAAVPAVLVAVFLAHLLGALTVAGAQ